MSTTRQIHKQAMAKAKLASEALAKNQKILYFSLLEEALELEKQAAYTLINTFKSEPTRGVLFRSAANMAFNLEKYELAITLARQGLNGMPFAEIHEELSMLIKNAQQYKDIVEGNNKEALYYDNIIIKRIQGGVAEVVNKQNTKIKTRLSLSGNYFEIASYTTENLPEEFINDIRKHRTRIIEFLRNVTDKSEVNQILPLMFQENGYVLSSNQLRLWAMSHFEETHIAFHSSNTLLIEGDLDKNAMNRAFYFLLERHESLRTIFKQNEYSEIKQFVNTPGNTGLSIVYTDLRKQENQHEQLSKLLVANKTQHFELATGPLVRLALYQTGENRWVFNCVMHNIISDGLSINVLHSELFLFYKACIEGKSNPLQPLHIQYKDYAAWQQQQINSDSFSEHKEYWSRQFSDELPVLDLPTDRQRPAIKTYNGGVVRKKLPTGLIQTLNHTSHEQGATLFMALVAGVNALLYRYTGQEDIILGTHTAGREHRDLENQIGFYVNTLALRTRFSGTNSFNSLLTIVKEVLLHAYQYRAYPFDELKENLSLRRNISRSPLFDVMVLLNYDDTPASGNWQHLDSLVISDYKESEHIVSKVDLLFAFSQSGDDMQLNIEYNSDIYNADTAERLALHWIQLVDQAVKNSDTAISLLDYLSSNEKKQLLETFNNTAVDYPVGKSIVELFEIQVVLTPESTALVYETTSLTYSQLNEMANRAGNYWRKVYHVQPDDVIAVELDRSHLTIIAILGVLKAGAAYLLIDPAYPQERIDYITADSSCKLKVGAADLQKAIEYHSIDARQNPPLLAAAGSLAYIIYTSGSTGKPKGVMVEHGNVVRLVKPLRYLHFIGMEVLLSTGAINFDATTFEYWGSLLNGGTLVMCNMQTLLDPALLSTAIKRHKVDTMWFTVGWLNQLIDNHIDIFEGLTNIVAGGDRLSSVHIAALRQQYPGLVVYNGYGPTENTTFSCCYTITTVGDNIPIGTPIDNSMAWIVDDCMQLLPIGAIGELCVGGAGLARGYLNRESLTKEKFVVNPFMLGQRMYRTGDLARWLTDGNIEFKGRRDHQVKIKGYRIELPEIEVALLGYPFVETVVVTARIKDGYDKELVAYFVASQQLNFTEIHHYLCNMLPTYMIPAHFVQIDEMPLTFNGKVDRNKLPDPEEMYLQSENPYVPPRNDVEEKLAAIWRDILVSKNIGIKNNFFTLGGHSLSVIRLVLGIRNEFNVNLKLADIFENPTIEEIASKIREYCASENFISHNSDDDKISI
jgi:amino acid adenylation domain-containing protein